MNWIVRKATTTTTAPTPPLTISAIASELHCIVLILIVTSISIIVVAVIHRVRIHRCRAANHCGEEYVSDRRLQVGGILVLIVIQAAAIVIPAPPPHALCLGLCLRLHQVVEVQDVLLDLQTQTMRREKVLVLLLELGPDWADE